MSDDKERQELYEILCKYGINEDKFIEFTVAAIDGYREEAKQNKNLTSPSRFKEVSEDVCKKELIAIASQAKKLQDGLAKMSHTASVKLFYAAGWQQQQDLNGRLKMELSTLVGAAEKAIKSNCLDEETSSKTISGGRPKKVVVKHLTEFLLKTWNEEKQNKATVSTRDGSKQSREFLQFVTAIFEYVGIKARANPERSAKDAISRQNQQ